MIGARVSGALRCATFDWPLGSTWRGVNLERGQLGDSDYKDYAGGARSTAAVPLM